MLENLNGGGSMQPLTLALSRKGALQNSLSLLFPRSLAPTLVVGERESRRRGRLSLAIPRQGNGRGFPLGLGCCSLLQTVFEKLLWIPA